MILYNEIDPIACAVLRATGHGYVDERDIRLVQPMDVWGYRRVHWFAGAGIWEVAARMAGWPLERELWTASCPCQGESVAGKKLGAGDPRHLWPDLFRLVRACRPAVIVGEQVDRAAGTHWLDGVWSDLEGEGYAFRAVDIPACAVDAPHRRNRIYWVAVADSSRRERRVRAPETDDEPEGAFRRHDLSGGSRCRSGAMEHAASERCGEGRPEYELRSGRDAATDANGSRSVADAEKQRSSLGDAGTLRGQTVSERATFESERRNDNRAMADADGGGCDGRAQDALGLAIGRDAAERADDDLGDACGSRFEGLADPERFEGSSPGWSNAQRTDRRNSRSYWDDGEWLRCADEKARRAKPGVRLLVDGLAGRADLWRLAGNSIVSQIAAEVLKALMETT